MGGFLKSRRIRSPKGRHVRPTLGKLRQAVFNICQNQVKGASFLDLFSGSGAMGIEALSRGARSSTFIEKDRCALNMIRSNVKDLCIGSLSTILAGDVLTWLKTLKGGSFDLIYVDPPYERELHMATLHLIDQLEILAKGGLLFIEECSLKDPLLKNITLRRERKVGRTLLYQFQTLS